MSNTCWRQKLPASPPDLHTSRWLGDIGPDIRKRLAKAGLFELSEEESQEPVLLGDFLDQYVAHRRDIKPSTRTQYQQVINSLLAFFGRDRRLDSVTPVDAERWRIQSQTQGNRRDADLDGLADNTIRRQTGRARQFFRHAQKLKLIDENPFDGFAVAVHGNTKRQQFIPQETIRQALAVCTCPEMRCVIALSRFGGIRVPSELARLTWQDIDFEAGRMTVRAPKSERYEDGGIRFCPIFPELRPFLQVLHDRANPGIDCGMSTPVINRWTSGTQNLRTEFERVLTKAGIKAWPKLYHNLRASRQRVQVSFSGGGRGFEMSMDVLRMSVAEFRLGFGEKCLGVFSF